MKALTSFVTVAVFMCCFTLPCLAAQGEEPESYRSVEERRILADIEKSKEIYQQKEEALRLKETELNSLALELEQKLTELEKLRDQIAELFKEKDTAETERIKTLSQMYEKMDKDKAAELLAQLDWQLSLAIMSQVKTKIRSKIISKMDPQYAIRYTTAYSTLEQD